MHNRIRTFEMLRNNDESGVSGTGSVLSGVILPSGAVVVEWHSKSEVNSLGVYKNYFDFYLIHCASHPTNNTQIIFDENRPEPAVKERRKNCRFCKNEYMLHPKDLQWEDSNTIRSCSGNLVTLKEEK